MAAIPLPQDLIDRTTVAAVEEKKKLQRHFMRFDIVFFLICTLVGLDTIGAVASNGAQAFTWLMFLGLLFFLPMALTMAELGAAFPAEGGPYIWTRLAFGRLVAAVNALLYWVSNPIWVGGTLAVTAIAAVNTFFLSSPMQGLPEYLFALVFIWFTVTAAITSFRIGKWVPTIGAVVRIAILAFFVVSVIIYAIEHGVHGFGGSAFLPSYAVFITVVPVLFFNYVGFELPAAAGEEMTNPKRDVPFAVLWSGLTTVLLLGVPILAILLVLPTGQATALGGFLNAIKAVFTVYGGHVAADGTATLSGAGTILGQVGAVAFIIGVLTSGTTWIIGADRAQAVAGFDGAGPRILGYFSRRFGTPVVVNVLSGIVATIVMVMALTITGGDTAKYFAVVLALVISTTTISYIAIFPTLIKLRYSHPHVDRPYRVPFGMAGVWVAGILTTFWAVFASVVLVWPGLGVNWFGNSGDPDASLAKGFTRLQFELSQFIPLAVLLVVGVIFYLLGTRTRKQVVEISLEDEMGVPEPVTNPATSARTPVLTR